MKKIISVITILTMLLTIVPFSVNAETVTSGNYGINITWTLDSDGLLTISGSGAIPNSSSPPWYNSKNSIQSIDE